MVCWISETGRYNYHSHTELVFPKKWLHKHLIYRIKIQCLYIKKENVKQIHMHTWLVIPKWKADLCLVFVEQGNLSPIQRTTNINMSTEALNREFFLSTETESWKQKRRNYIKVGLWVSWQDKLVKKKNTLFMLWQWLLREDGSSHLGSGNGIHISTARTWMPQCITEKMRWQKSAFQGWSLPQSFPSFPTCEETWGSKQGIDFSLGISCNSPLFV